jgi:hypothetical protein
MVAILTLTPELLEQMTEAIVQNVYSNKLTFPFA